MEKIKLLLSGNKRIEFYIDAAEKSGADVTADYPPKVSTDYDGLILCGGSDVDPKYYDQPINGSTDIENDRDEIEFALLKAFLDAGKPVFGICRGYQLINIFLGGNLYQHIEETPIHKLPNRIDSVHSVTAKKDSILGVLYGESFSVNSSHHQAINRLGKGLIPTAFWQDKYIEAFEHENLPIFGVQWHPERTCYNMARPDTCDGSELFKYFISLCKKYKK